MFNIEIVETVLGRLGYSLIIIISLYYVDLYYII